MADTIEKDKSEASSPRPGSPLAAETTATASSAPHQKQVWWDVLVITVLSAISKYIWIAEPNQIVFDESHFGYFTNEYSSRFIRFHDIHPPLGKLTLAAWARFFVGYHGHQKYRDADIGSVYMDDTYVGLRLLPAFFGTLLPPIMYLTMRLGWRSSRAAALLVGVFSLCEHGSLLEARLILTDSQLFTYCHLGFLLYLIQYRDRMSFWKAFWCGIAFGAMLSVKWVAALATYGVCGLIEANYFLQRLWKHGHSVKLYKHLLRQTFTLIIVPLIFHLYTWYWHFRLLKMPGFGSRYVSNAFTQKGWFEQVWEENTSMLYGSAGITSEHPFASWYYEWPIMTRAVRYWDAAYDDGRTAVIALLGNPMVWWPVGIAVILYTLLLVIQVTFGQPLIDSKSRSCDAADGDPVRRDISMLLVPYLGWVINMVPFVPVTRQCFLYHGIPSVLYGMMLVAFLLERAGASVRTFRLVGLIAIVGFVFWAPITYGIPLTATEYASRIWIQGWN